MIFAVWAAWTLGCAATMVALLRWPRVAALVTLAGLVAVLSLGDHRLWEGWFVGVKTISILFAAAAWAFGMGIYRYPYLPQLATFLLWMNTAELALAELLAGNLANGALVGTVAMCVPWPSEWKNGSHGQLGFDSPAWIVANLSTLISFYLFCPTVNSLWVPTTTILVLAALGTVWWRDARVWMTWRMYSLWYFITQYNLTPAVEDRLDPHFFSRALRQSLREGPVYLALLALSAGLTGWLVLERVRKIGRLRAAG